MSVKYDPAMKVVRWVLGPAKDAVRYLGGSITKLYMGTIAKKQGDRRGFNVGAPAGCVAWPVDPSQHGGMSFIASDVFFAEYDAKAKQVWCLDDANGKRHPGADPLTVGDNVTIHNGDKRSGKGVVVRSAEYGTAGLDKNVFIHADGDLIAHHRQPDPPTNSSMIHDPGEGPDDWAGGLHYPLRVRKFIRGFCEITSAAEPLFAPLLNFTTNGDGTIAQGAAHWGRGEGLLSDEAFGPLAPCDDGIRHRLGETGDARVYEAGLNITTTKHGDPQAGILYSPNLFDLTPYVPASTGPFYMETPYREDFALQHPTICNGNQIGKKRWESYAMLTEWGPPPRYPEDPPPRYPRQPEDPPIDDNPPRQIIPGDPSDVPGPHIEVPYSGAPEDGSSTSGATPAELEAPSAYGHPAPTGPEPRQPGIAGTTDREQYWLNRYGFTEREFAESPITSHMIHTAVHESATANDKANGAARWPTVKTQDAIVYYDANGNVIARTQPAKGPGAVTFAGSDIEMQELYTDVNPISDAQRQAFSLGIFSAAHSGGVQVVDGEIGLGSRHPTKAGIIKGWRARLDFARLADPNTPDLYLDQIDEEGNTSTTGKFYVNGTDITTFGTGDVTASGTLTSNKLIIGGGTTAVSASAITRDASENLSGIGTIASGKHTITQATIGQALEVEASTPATNTDTPGEGTYHSEFAFTSASAQDLRGVVTASNTCGYFELRAIMRCTSSSDGLTSGNACAMFLQGAWQNSGGTVTVDYTATIEDPSGEFTTSNAGLLLAVSGTTVKVQVVSNDGTATVEGWAKIIQGNAFAT